MIQQAFETFVRANPADYAADQLRAFVIGQWTNAPIAFIEGKQGLGKTHLMQSATTLYRATAVKVVFLSATEFVHEALSAERRQKLPNFLDSLSRGTVLILDDIQLALTRPHPLRTAIRTFAEARKPLIVSSDRSPLALTERLGQREASLLRSGLHLALLPPEIDARRQIARRAIEDAEADIPEDVIELLVHAEATPREVLTKVARLLMYADCSKEPISTEMLARIDPAAARPPHISIGDIVARTAEFYDLTLSDFYSPQRCRRVARPRQVAMFLARKFTTRSLPEIGRRFGGRDHTTVLHACKRVVELRGKDPVFSSEVEFLSSTVAAAAHTGR
jgi:chromosomal replication initiator protein